MKMRIFPLFVLAVAAAGAGELDDGLLRGRTDRDRPYYEPGEEMVFTLKLDRIRKFPEGKWFISWDRSGDDGRKEHGKVPASLTEPLVVRTSLDRPGFVRVRAVLVDEKGNVYRKQYTGDTTTPEGKRAQNEFERRDRRIFFDGGAGVHPERLASHPEPKDFDAFWAAQADRLKLVPIKAERIEVACGNPKARIFAVQIACAGLRPVTGYLTIPRAAETGARFPARLETHGYSGDRCQHDAPTWARSDEIVLNINAHGQKLKEFGATEADRKALRWETRSHDKSYAFDALQNADPEVAYFNGMVLRVKRALQYLKTLPEWNGKDLIASGGSQGGLQTIWAAGCGEGLTRAESGITWCCDMYTSGKLRLDPRQNLASDGWYIPWTDAMGYYDAANFAKRIPASCQTIITRAGLGDYCCPPTGLAKMYNNIPGANKKILWVQGSTHGYVPPEPNVSYWIEGPQK
ncbi:MAG: acetylxylan esterase [Kiritimatiellia bacterium]